MKNSLIALGIAVVCIVLMYQYQNAMMSPGELSNGHQVVTHKCSSCHEPFWGIPNDKCIACHKLSDIGKRIDTSTNDKKIPFHNYLKNQKCTSCHSDHNGVNPEILYGSFRHDLLSETLKNQCKNCHRIPYDKIHNQLSGECRNCHNTEGWKFSVRFDHDLIKGVDRNDCVTCHKKPKDTFHNSSKDDCIKCHYTNKWVPSSFNHSTYFILDKNHNAQCNTCHPNNDFLNYSCYGCHEHSESKIREEHDEEGINNLNACISCHKSGSKHEIESNHKSKNDSHQKEGNHEGEDSGDDD